MAALDKVFTGRRLQMVTAVAAALYYTSRQQSKRNRVARGGTHQMDKAGLKPLLHILFPGLWNKQMLLLLCHSGFLVARTFASIVLARMDGNLVRFIIERDLRGFLWQLVTWIAFALPTSFINSMLHYLESKLSIALRTRLVEHAYGIYMSDDTYYKVGNLDTRLPNPDQCMTEDIQKFCDALCHIYSHVSKPLLDVVLMTMQLLSMGAERTGKGLGPVVWLCATVVALTASVLRVSTPPFGKLVAMREEAGGELRALHARVITHSEEIAFFGGHQAELAALQKVYKGLVATVNKLLEARLGYVTLEQFFLKYVWAATGMTMLAYPTFSDPERTAQVAASERTGFLITARKLLVDGADAVERIIGAGKEIAELGGYAQRVNHMLQVFEDCRVGRYSKSEDSTASSPRAGGEVIHDDDRIEFNGVSIVTPGGDVLVDDLNFAVGRGEHLLICGPNGCGKSSLFRILGDLWPVIKGTVRHPHRHNMFYVPQRPYLTTGTLRNQLIYPHTKEQAAQQGMSDTELMDILKAVKLEHVILREGGWDACKDWRDVMSGGEKQRMGFARVLYHKPTFAILDECTSQVSIDVEGQMYAHCKAMGITCLTVSHRPTLWKYHTHLLQFDGQGGCRFCPLDASTRLELREEKDKLESELASVPEKEKRLARLCELLGEESSFVALLADGPEEK